MGLKLVWLPQARADLERLYQFLADKNPQAAKRAIQQILESALLLKDNPKLAPGWQVDPHFRELRIAVGKSNYRLRYAYHNGTIVIVRIWHGRELG